MPDATFQIDGPVPVSPTNSAAETTTLVALTRLEAKVDVALTQHGADLKAQGRDIADHEERLRVVEQRPYVAPKTLWSAVVGGGGLVVAILSLVQTFLNH